MQHRLSIIYLCTYCITILFIYFLFSSRKHLLNDFSFHSLNTVFRHVLSECDNSECENALENSELKLNNQNQTSENKKGVVTNYKIFRYKDKNQVTEFSIDKPSMTNKFLSRYYHSHLFDYSGCVKGRELYTDDYEIANSSQFDVSLLLSSSINRLFLFPITAKRWSGPIVYVVHMKEEEEEIFTSFLTKKSNSILCDSRISIFAYISKPNAFFHSNYPINILRNIAIRHSKTSHFLLLDMDMLISHNAYETIKNLPPSILQEKNAFVLPSFFSYNWKLPDLPLEDQMVTMIKRIPKSTQELRRCLMKKKCSHRKKDLFTHFYVLPEWLREFDQPFAKPYYNYTCWPNRYQEPYVMVKRNDSITLFNEKLINYGHNKITFVENLRFHEYQFVLLGKVYAFDIPHAKSSYQKSHAKEQMTPNWFEKTYYLKYLYNESLQRKNVMKLCMDSNPY